MVELFPAGFEEVELDADLELAAYGDAGAEERFWHVFGPGSVVEVDEGWEEAWKQFHRPLRIGQLFKRAALNIDQMGYFKRVLETGKGPPGDRGSMRSGQLGDSSAGRGSESVRVDSGAARLNGARPRKIP